jgi:hypothetical protein
MTQEPNNNPLDEEEDDSPIDMVAQSEVESLEGYQDYNREHRGNNLTFGDY